VDRNLVRVSKRLSRALRHAPGAAGLVLDAQGWVAVADVLAALALPRHVLDAVVEGNDKRRFALATGDDGVLRIRASQGHSVRVDLALSPRIPPDRLYHGTPTANLASIAAAGLRAGRRNHVHLAADVDTADAVGRRRGLQSTVLIVDAAAMTSAGHIFLVSANGVWLTDHVPPQFLIG
jgi:putative RNA 2'-phosphotransferase